MKIRHGFVSNSSSSSFVVAFPKKPKSYEDVYEMMFNSEDGGISCYGNEGLSHAQIAQRVWKDLESGSNGSYEGYKTQIPACKEDIIEEFSGRYEYYPASSNCSSYGASKDELGGQWCGTGGKYCGSDKDALIAYRDHVIESEAKGESIQDRQDEIYQTEFLAHNVEVPYAYKDRMDYRTNKKYTAKQVKAYDDYSSASRKFKEENKEYASLEKERRAFFDEKWAKSDELTKGIAEADANAFIEDNKDAWIAILSYADDGGESTLEHGDIFRNVVHTTISHH